MFDFSGACESEAEGGGVMTLDEARRAYEVAYPLEEIDFYDEDARRAYDEEVDAIAEYYETLDEWSMEWFGRKWGVVEE